MEGLSGKAALVTGGNRGIGRAIAARLRADGARVAIVARDAGALEAVASELDLLWRPLDITDTEAVDATVDELASEMGGLDILVNNAGVMSRGPLADIPDQEWLHVMNTNLTGAFRMMRAALRHLGEGGRIVNISSVLGIFGAPDTSAYTASKHGLLSLTRTAALELGGRGITVNAVCPGWTRTDMTEDGIADLAEVWGLDDDRALQRIERMMPIGRLLEPEEVAAAVGWLCSAQGAAVTAQAVRVDGGQTAY